LSVRSRNALLLLFFAFPLAWPAQANGGEMSVATFLAKSDSLMAKGPFALLSKDYKLLKAVGKAAGANYQTRLAREREQGKASSCPPRRARPSNNQFLNHLRDYPAAARSGTTMHTAMADYFIRAYPCD
jgi:hypothetical protein